MSFTENQNNFDRITQNKNDTLKTKLKYIEKQLKELNEKEKESKLNIEKLNKIEGNVKDIKSNKIYMKTMMMSMKS